MSALIVEIQEAGHDDKHLLLAFRVPSGARLEIAIPYAEIGKTVAMMLRASAESPHQNSLQSDFQAPAVPVSMTIASGPKMEPVLALNFGPVAMAATMREDELANLVDGMRKFLSNPAARKN